MYERVRYRPTVKQTPSEGNLRRARQHLQAIRDRITAGMFCFADEFPDFRYLKSVPGAGSPRTCGEVFDAFLTHCAARVTKDDMAPITSHRIERC